MQILFQLSLFANRFFIINYVTLIMAQDAPKRRFLSLKNNIECVKETVFLGVILDEHLSWKPHILNDSRKISKSIGIIYKSSFCLPKTSLRCLHYSLVYPNLIYCVSVRGSTYHSNLKRIIILQKKIIRIISKVSFDSHTDV